MLFAAWMLAGCAPTGAEAWEGTFELTSFQEGAVPTTTTPTTSTSTPTPTTPATPPTAKSALDTSGCPATADADWNAAGFAITVDPLQSGSYVEILPCESSESCTGYPWMGGATLDLDEGGGTAKFAATNFLADPDGGGRCDLQWWTLAISGTVDAPALDLVFEEAGTFLETGNSLDCEDRLEDTPVRDCTSRGLLSGRRW
jgi:hypothetical protein